MKKHLFKDNDYQFPLVNKIMNSSNFITFSHLNT